MKAMRIKAGRVKVAALAAVCAVALVSCATFQQGTRPSQVSQLEYGIDDDLAERFGHIPSILLELLDEPPETLSAQPAYFSREPLYTFIRVGTGGDDVIVMALDESRGTGSGYNTLYVDANNNNDLSDDPELDGKSAADKQVVEFPAVELTVTYGDEAHPYRVKPSLDSSQGALQVSAAGYCEGELTVGRNRHRVALIDNTMNGTFDDPYTPPENRGEPWRGDTLLIQVDGEGEPTRHGVGKYVSIGDRCYEIDIAPDGRTISATRANTACGRINVSAERCSALLVGRDSAFVLDGAADLTVPAGTYQLVQCGFEAKNDNGQIWRIVDRGQLNELSVKVEANRRTSLAFGPPLVAEVFVTQRASRSFQFDLAVTGQGGGKYSARDLERVGEEAPPAPVFAIRDENDEIVATGRFQYG
jgi:hypothetical protein